MDVAVAKPSDPTKTARVGSGLSAYYEQKISELQFIVSEKQRNLQRLEAQRNELNSKGKRLLSTYILY